jgi:hypothetical protein
VPAEEDSNRLKTCMIHLVSKRIGTAYNSQNDNESQSCHETHRFPPEPEEASSLVETTMSPPRRPECCAEAKFFVATARKRAMVVLVRVRFMLVLGLEGKVLC